MDRLTEALQQRSLIGAQETLGGGVLERPLQHCKAEPLRRLCLHDHLARDGSRDHGSVGGALDLLDGVDGRHPGDCGAVLFYGGNDRRDGLGGDERTHRIVYQNNIVLGGAQRVQRVGDRLLPVFTALDDMHLVTEIVLPGFLPEQLRLGFPHSDPDLADFLGPRELAECVYEDRNAFQLSELLAAGPALSSGRGGRHAGAETGGGNNYYYFHRGQQYTRQGGVFSNPVFVAALLFTDLAGCGKTRRSNERGAM